MTVPACFAPQFKVLKGLEQINERHMPDDLGKADSDDDNYFIAADCVDDDQEVARLAWQVAQLPVPNLHPAEGARLTAGTSTYVGQLFLGTTAWDPSATLPEIRGKGERGKDKTQRKARRCKRCLHNNDDQHASECKGRGGENKCEYYDVHGNPKN